MYLFIYKERKQKLFLLLRIYIALLKDSSILTVKKDT